jgi:tRNA threonylcarbamoyladenosine biosynthesis protein TsaE
VTEFLSKSPRETAKIAEALAGQIVKEGQLTQGPVVIGLSGDLGAGKTTFVQGLARGLGIDPKYYVNSPTFTLINEYEGPKLRLIHVDLYRIEKSMDLVTIGLVDYMRAGHVIAIEWVERLDESKKMVDFQVKLENTKGGNGRIIFIDDLS